MTMDSRIERARNIIETEAAAVRQLGERIDDAFIDAVNRILALPGRVVTAGMGKAGIIAQKISATFASTGTSSIYLHPADAIHGDLGRVDEGDLLLAFSKSGETEEVLRLLAPVKSQGVPVVAVTQSRQSSLGRHSDLVLEIGEIEEAGAYRLAPTASTTAMLALCDALALVVQEGRKFGPDEFARYHPGGDLGRRLMKVEELMRRGNRNPKITTGATVLNAIRVMTSTLGRPGATSIIGTGDKLVGFFTDGDLRRMLESKPKDLDALTIDEVMTRNPMSISPETYALEALAYMHKRQIDQLPVVDEDKCLLGLLDVQDLLDLQIG